MPRYRLSKLEGQWVLLDLKVQVVIRELYGRGGAVSEALVDYVLTYGYDSITQEEMDQLLTAAGIPRKRPK